MPIIEPSGAAAGGGSQPLATLSIGDSDEDMYQSCAAAIIGGESFSGALNGSLSYFLLAAPTGPVVNLASVLYALAGTVESTEDAFDANIDVNVSDATGANAATCQFQFQLPSPVTDLAASGSLTGVTWEGIVGTDLSADGDVLSSTAGLNYFVLVTFLGSWD